MSTLRRILEEDELWETFSPSPALTEPYLTDSSSNTTSSSTTYFFWDFSRVSNDEKMLDAAKDVNVDAVVTSLYFNGLVFVMLMAIYECLRRALPSVYSSQKRMNHMKPADGDSMYSFRHLDRNTSCSDDEGEYKNMAASENPDRSVYKTMSEQQQSCSRFKHDHILKLESKSILPDSRPLDWILPVLGVPWPTVLESAGLDGYFFLRYIRMCVRITAVSSFWFFLILVPSYATGKGNHSKYNTNTGWYYLSTENIPATGWRMWLACFFAYFFAFFVFFVIKQEYRHFLHVRQDFFAKGSVHVHPQHHYSLLVEGIPCELRSDRALADYFNKLFPGKVHSASVVLKLPDLEDASARCLRSCRRLEKSIALLHATGKRPTHCVGRGRVYVLGIELLPIDCAIGDCCGDDDHTLDELPDDDSAEPISETPFERPKRGTRVDSIKYYTQELAMHSRALYRMQQRKFEIAESGNDGNRSDGWFDDVVREATNLANKILSESAIDNDLVTSTNTYVDAEIAEHMSSKYGSLNVAPLNGVSHTPDSPSSPTYSDRDSLPQRLSVARKSKKSAISELFTSTETERRKHLIDEYLINVPKTNIKTPFGSENYTSGIRRMLGRIGLDFLIAVIKFIHGYVNFALEGVIAETMSSTGMVTFRDLASVTCAASAPLTVKASVLDVSVAPEPREIIWENAHVSKKTQSHREYLSNAVLFLGVVLWSFPLAFIQAVAKVDVISQLPGMEWLMEYNGGNFSRFVNGYLPVVGLLALIMILPVLFEYIAVKYEHRKTLSDVQSSMIGRYFNYQLVNIYVTVSAGSMLTTIGDIVSHPIAILHIGDAFPRMAGYFMALLVTKILAGLPMIFLRFGALSRMLLLKLLSNEKKLTQREVDAVYRLENVQYGWEFPTQLLVVVIVFTYAIMVPLILPVGLVYFLGALTVYKKQVLYVYSPVYESGGAMFPLAVQKTLFGLVCAQITFLGYVVSKGCHYQPLFIFPLPFLTVATSDYFKKTYADPSERLSLERARAFDRLGELRNQVPDPLNTATEDTSLVNDTDTKFDKLFYRQPVLTEVFREPWTYRRGIHDDETMAVREELRRTNLSLTKKNLRNILGAMSLGSLGSLNSRRD